MSYLMVNPIKIAVETENLIENIFHAINTARRTRVWIFRTRCEKKLPRKECAQRKVCTQRTPRLTILKKLHRNLLLLNNLCAAYFRFKSAEKWIRMRVCGALCVWAEKGHRSIGKCADFLSLSDILRISNTRRLASIVKSASHCMIWPLFFTIYFHTFSCWSLSFTQKTIEKNNQ